MKKRVIPYPLIRISGRSICLFGFDMAYMIRIAFFNVNLGCTGICLLLLYFQF